MINVAFKTLGCRLNLYETDALASKFAQNGFNIVESDWQKADVVIINTCTITNKSDRKSRDYIYRALRGHALVVVTGCMAQQYKDELESSGINAIIIDNEHKNRIFDIVKEKLNSRDININDFEGNVFGYDPAKQTFHTRSIVKIQDGCNNFCTYCIVPYVRGRAVSRKNQDVLFNVKQELEAGFKEIVLTGVNIGHYRDQDIDFADLVEKILETEGDFRLRIASIEPENFSEKFFQLFKNKKLAPHLHLCLQSGSNAILKRMHRKYTIEDFYNIVDRFRAEYPEFNFTTDIIAGFPGETEEDFNQTVEAARRIKFGHIHVFKYSGRNGTMATKMPDQIDERVKAQRAEVLRKLSVEMSKEYEAGFKGKSQRVLAETIDNEGYLTGYGENYFKIRFKTDDAQTNEFYDITI